MKLHHHSSYRDSTYNSDVWFSLYYDTNSLVCCLCSDQKAVIYAGRNILPLKSQTGLFHFKHKSSEHLMLQIDILKVLVPHQPRDSFLLHTARLAGDAQTSGSSHPCKTCCTTKPLLSTTMKTVFGSECVKIPHSAADTPEMATFFLEKSHGERVGRKEGVDRREDGLSFSSGNK